MPFSSSHRPNSLARIIAGVAVALILLLDVLAVCPQAHEFFHHDADHEDHECVVTQFHHGFTPVMDLPRLVPEPVAYSEMALPIPALQQLNPAPLVRLPPPCGPPAV